MTEPTPMSFQTLLSLQQNNSLQAEGERLRLEQAARMALRAKREELENRGRSMNVAQLARSFVPQQEPLPEALVSDSTERSQYERVTTQGGFPPPPSGPTGGT